MITNTEARTSRPTKLLRVFLFTPFWCGLLAVLLVGLVVLASLAVGGFYLFTLLYSTVLGIPMIATAYALGTASGLWVLVALPALWSERWRRALLHSCQWQPLLLLGRFREMETKVGPLWEHAVLWLGFFLASVVVQVVSFGVFSGLPPGELRWPLLALNGGCAAIGAVLQAVLLHYAD